MLLAALEMTTDVPGCRKGERKSLQRGCTTTKSHPPHIHPSKEARWQTRLEKEQRAETRRPCVCSQRFGDPIGIEGLLPLGLTLSHQLVPIGLCTIRISPNALEQWTLQMHFPLSFCIQLRKQEAILAQGILQKRATEMLSKEKLDRSQFFVFI